MLISTNHPFISGIWGLALTSTITRLRLQRAATESSHPQKKTGGTKEVQQWTTQGQPGTRHGQPGTNQGQPGTKQEQSGTKQGQWHN